MELTEKIIGVLQKSLNAESIQLDDDDGISGFVVSSQFENKSTFDRQQMIDAAIRGAPDALSSEELRQILMIAGLTPLEYESTGGRIRVHTVRELSDGSLEVLLHGGISDAEYVRGALNNEKGVTTTDPEQITGERGTLMRFCAKGTGANPLSIDKALRALRTDRYIAVLQNSVLTQLN